MISRMWYTTFERWTRNNHACKFSANIYYLKLYAERLGTLPVLKRTPPFVMVGRVDIRIIEFDAGISYF